MPSRFTTRRATTIPAPAAAVAPAPALRRRTVTHGVGIPPIATHGTHAAPHPDATKRVALVRSHPNGTDAVVLLRKLATAARARIQWSEHVGAAGPVLAQALGASDAVVVDRLPSFRPGERSPLPRFHAVVRAPSAFGSSLDLRSIRRSDLLVVGAVQPGAAAWEAAVRLAADWARAEGREALHCAVRDPGWPILASDRAARFRRIVADLPGLRARQVGHHDTRRRLLLEPHEFAAIVADASDVDALVRAAASGAGWSNRVPSIWLGDDCALVVLGDAAGAPRIVETGETALAIARATERLLRRVGEVAAAERLGAAIAGELRARIESTRDLWLDLASETPEGVVAAIAERLVEPAPEESLAR
jgi:hypothetical protein